MWQHEWILGAECWVQKTKQNKSKKQHPGDYSKYSFPFLKIKSSKYKKWLWNMMFFKGELKTQNSG